ncbi:MAG: hypothetical protein ACERIH_02835 [Labilibaculum antarcticum]
MSFVSGKIISEGLTFDDVLLVPAYSEVLVRAKRTFYEVICQLVGVLRADISW